MTVRLAAAFAAGFCIGGLPAAGWAQTFSCDRKLSALAADIDALSEDYRASDRRMQALMAAVGAIEDGAMAASVCPDDIPGRIAARRAEVAALEAAGLIARAEADLQCSQGFVGRVSRDIAQAQSDNNSAMVVRLNSISKRILDLDAQATQLAMGIGHLASRRSRLLEALDLAGAHCGQMDDIYE